MARARPAAAATAAAAAAAAGSGSGGGGCGGTSPIDAAARGQDLLLGSQPSRRRSGPDGGRGRPRGPFHRPSAVPPRGWPAAAVAIVTSHEAPDGASAGRLLDALAGAAMAATAAAAAATATAVAAGAAALLPLLLPPGEVGASASAAVAVAEAVPPPDRRIERGLAAWAAAAPAVAAAESGLSASTAAPAAALTSAVAAPTLAFLAGLLRLAPTAVVAAVPSLYRQSPLRKRERQDPQAHGAKEGI